MLVGRGFGDRLVPAAGSQKGEARPAAAIAASLMLHMAILACAVVMRFAVPAPQMREIPVRVSIVTESDRAVVPTPTPSPSVLASRPPSEPVPAIARPPPQAAKPAMIEASTMLSARTLADPRSRQARADLATFADGERVVQLCNLEAMDQVEASRKDLRPEQVVAYARSNERMAGDTIEANGAAIFSRKTWYDLVFKCRVSADHRKVVAFAFSVGEPVPRSDWDALGLPASGPDD